MTWNPTLTAWLLGQREALGERAQSPEDRHVGT